MWTVYEIGDLHGRHPVISPAVQAQTRALRCAMLCRDCCDHAFSLRILRFFFF